MIESVAVGSAGVHIMQAAVAQRGADELVGTLVGPSEQQVRAAFGDREPIAWSFNPILIRTAEHHVLVDAGLLARSDGPVTGMVELLSEAGVPVSAITHVFVTHGHGDHVGGLVDEDGSAVFPNARLVTHSIEYQHWTDGAGSGDSGAVFRAACRPYAQRTDLLGTLNDAPLSETRILQDHGLTISARLLPGHTPGHCGLVLRDGDSVLHLGVDTLHADLQFPQPAWSVKFDTNPELAAQTRQAYLSELAESGRSVVWYHLPFPGIGSVGAGGQGFTWTPAAR